MPHDADMEQRRIVPSLACLALEYGLSPRNAVVQLIVPLAKTGQVLVGVQRQTIKNEDGAVAMLRAMADEVVEGDANGQVTTTKAQRGWRARHVRKQVPVQETVSFRLEDPVQVISSFNLSLTKEQRAAKSKVRLPYLDAQHHEESSDASSATDPDADLDF